MVMISVFGVVLLRKFVPTGMKFALRPVSLSKQPGRANPKGLGATGLTD